ncbi:Oidioi.mRNA.OKI2018_I69.PAR.g10158.t1.cds [Oikopleura dioica]|uniref:Oidioi.mRNA.OKI2018_I69.PAR.g10158.t1.cds n=1 Tax=Oikopleura dioica TaxID=34765 RepID=A0ABN7RPD9_OIKDI|nr:Oidioi.mRNA.OKI2018_I69.PAR.g10158.t1.cds [Oikopleura dioica]
MPLKISHLAGHIFRQFYEYFSESLSNASEASWEELELFIIEKYLNTGKLQAIENREKWNLLISFAQNCDEKLFSFVSKLAVKSSKVTFAAALGEDEEKL